MKASGGEAQSAVPRGENAEEMGFAGAEARRALEPVALKDAGDEPVKTLLKLVRTMEKSKQEANELFNRGAVAKARDRYSEALDLCPWAVLYNARLLSNRGACHLKLGDYSKVVADCSAALDLSPTYIKALLHRVLNPLAPFAMACGTDLYLRAADETMRAARMGALWCCVPRLLETL